MKCHISCFHNHIACWMMHFWSLIWRYLIRKEKQLSYLRSVELSIISCLKNLQVHSSMARFLSRLDHIFSTVHYHSSVMIYECLLNFFFVANIAYYMGDLFSFKLKPVQHSFWPKYLLMLTSPLPAVINNNFYYCWCFALTSWTHGRSKRHV